MRLDEVKEASETYKAELKDRGVKSLGYLAQ